MKKKVISIALALLVFGTGAQVYAETFLDTNIVGLIQNSIQGSVETVTEEIEQTNMDQTEVVTSYIDEKNDKLDKELDEYKEAELNRANAELTDFVKGLKEEVDSVYGSETAIGKEKIRHQVDNKIEEEKEKLLEALEEKFQD